MFATHAFAASEGAPEKPDPIPSPHTMPMPHPGGPLPGGPFTGPPQQQPEAAEPDKPLAQRKPPKITRKNRAEFLTSLYDQLQAAPDEEAAERLAKGIERVWRQSGSDTADLLMERAGIAIQAKKFDLAIQILGGVTAVAPEYAEGWNQLASVYFLQEDYEKAMQGLRHVLSLEPKHYKAIEGLALILREMGNKKGALNATRRALSIYPHLKSAQQQQEELTRDVEGQGI